MTHLDLFSGIGGFALSFEYAGFATAAFAEIEPFPSRVLAYRWPTVPNLGDVRAVNGADWRGVDVVTFGSPCQDLSVAGKRAGLAGERSGLFHEAIRIVAECGARFALWENVPGAYSSNGGRDFAAVLDALADIGALDIAWATLDAQWFGVPQRRRRVFVVADFGGERAGEILAECEGLRGHPAPSRTAGEGVARSLTTGSGGGRYDKQPHVAQPLRAGRQYSDMGDGSANVIPVEPQTFDWQASCSGDESWQGKGRSWIVDPPGRTRALNAQKQLAVAHALRADGFDASEDGTGRGTPLVPIGFRPTDGLDVDMSPTMKVGTGLKDRGEPPAVAFASETGQGWWSEREPTLRAENTTSKPNCMIAVDTLPREEYRNAHASSEKDDAREVLSALRQTIGAEAFAQWGLGILGSFLPAEVLRQAVHGSELRPAPFSRDWLVYCSLPRAEAGAEGAMQSVREARREGRTPSRREPSKQLARQLGTYLSKLSQPGASVTSVMRDLRRADEGSRLLQQALDQVEEAWRSACLPGPAKEAVLRGGVQRDGARQGDVRSSLHAGEARQFACGVRRLSPVECEFLQGFPRNWTAIPGAADGPRYRALGNSVAVPVVEWIARRMAAVLSQRKAA